MRRRAVDLDSGAHVDLVFSDVVMPKSSGIALARLARERRPGLPIVLATGFPDAIDDVTDSGAIPLIKPYSIPRLEAVSPNTCTWTTRRLPEGD